MSNIDKQVQYESKFSRLWERYDEASHGNAQQMRDILEVTLDALESAERQILRLEKLAEAESVGADKAATSGVEWMKRYHAAEKRIAELEAREIKPAKGEVLVVVSGFTGCGKSAIAGEIEIAMKAIGVPVQWTNGDAEKRMTGADWLTAIEMYKPTVRIVEVNVPRAAGIGVKGE